MEIRIESNAMLIDGIESIIKSFRLRHYHRAQTTHHHTYLLCEMSSVSEPNNVLRANNGGHQIGVL